MGGAALAVVLVAALAVACWSTVRDHVEAWRFQITRETRVALGGGWRCGNVSREENLVLHLAAFSGRPVIFAYDEDDAYDAPLPQDVTLGGAEGVLRVLASMNYRVLEQYFPRRAYVVINPSPRLRLRPKGSWRLSEADKDDLRKAFGAR